MLRKCRQTYIEYFLNSFLENQIPTGNFNFDGKFLVIVNNITAEYLSLVRRISERFYYDYIININILIPSPSSTNQVLMFTYFPYKPHRCSRCNIGLYNIFESGKFLKQKEHFPNKLHNFYNCTIVVASFNTTPYVSVNRDKNGKLTLSGFEGQLFSTIAESLNLSTKLIIPPQKWGTAYPNQSFTGAFGLV